MNNPPNRPSGGYDRHSNSGRSSPGGGRDRPDASSFEVYFDPKADPIQLFDTLAEKQASQFEDRKLTSSQLRRFFGEVKNLYRQFETRCAALATEQEKAQEYANYIAPKFKMIRSKVSYAERTGSNRIPANFSKFLKDSIRKVENHHDFERFVLHFEAVVGFMYGQDKVGN